MYCINTTSIFKPELVPWPNRSEHPYRTVDERAVPPSSLGTWAYDDSVAQLQVGEWLQ